MEYEDLLLEKEGGIATITLNVPHKLNAITLGIRRSLPLVVDEIAKDDDVRVVIVTGAGRGFCSGADVTDLTENTDEPPEISRHERRQLVGWGFAEIFPKLDKTVIAAINGACVGGGFSLALSCDIRIASEMAKFGVAQISRALVPDIAMTYFLPRITGTSGALELMLTAEIISATEAERSGIVSRVVPPDELMKVTRELADKIAQQAPIPVELTKKILYRAMLDDIARQLDLESWAQEICLNTEDHKESVRAFFEKRLPQFKGK
ncbi:enoyl-CoA hydratase/isomerase family protein [Chloroflexota bacterium]